MYVYIYIHKGIHIIDVFAVQSVMTGALMHWVSGCLSKSFSTLRHEKLNITELYTF